MKARVYLATTAGPVRVERLTRETALQSAVCLGRTTKVLAVSADYDAFVRQPSGVIEREFGPMEPGAFRLDVDRPIDDGDSWQLGLFAAHMLAGDFALAGPEDEADRAIWLTGAVHNDLTVGPVDHIPEKLRASRETFAALAGEGLPLTLVLPPGGGEHARAAGLPDGIAVVEVASTGELAPILAVGKPPLTAGQRPAGSTPEGDRPAGSTPEGDRPARGGRLLFLLIFLLVLVAGAAAILIWRDYQALGQLTAQNRLPALAEELVKAEEGWWARRIAAELIRRQLRAALPAAGEVTLEIIERRAPEGRTCAAVHFGNVDAVMAPARPGPDGRYPMSVRDGLCGLAFSVVTDPDLFHATVMFKTSSGKFIYGESVLEPVSGTLVFSGVANWTIELPRRPDEPFAYGIELAASRNPVNANTISLLGSPGIESADDFADLGILYTSVEHRVEP